MSDLTEGRDPAKLLRWIINETSATPHYNNANSAPNASADGKDDIPVTSLSDMEADERQKWTQIILGQTPDILNNRNSLQRAIERLQQIEHTMTEQTATTTVTVTTTATPNENDNENENEESLTGNEEIKCCLSIIHHLLDKNEAVLAKLNGVPLLLRLMRRSLTMERAICLDCITILHDATQNNPMMQNHLYSHHAVLTALQTLQNCRKTEHAIRAKLWAFLHVACFQHNPNLNIFLANTGHHEIQRVLRIEQNNVSSDLLKEILRVSRFIHYLLALWSDGNAKVFEILDLLQSINWTVYSLHAYVIRLVSIENEAQMSATQRLQLSQTVLDILMELIGGIRMFMKRDDKCKKFIIANKRNKDVIQQMKAVQRDFGAYCAQHRPQMRLEEKSVHGRPYKFRYYTLFNEAAREYDALDAIAEEKEKEAPAEDEEDNGEHMYLAMADIWNIIHSILRDKEEYRAQRQKERQQSQNDISGATSLGGVHVHDEVADNAKQYKIQVSDATKY